MQINAKGEVVPRPRVQVNMLTPFKHISGAGRAVQKGNSPPRPPLDGNDLVMRIFQFNYLSSEFRMEKTQDSILDGRKKV